MRIKKSELIRIIRESFDVINSETGEITDHAPHADAVFNIMKRLGISPDPNEGMPGAQEVYLSNDDWMKFDKETWGKSHKRKEKADKIRTDIKNVLPKLDQWAADAGEQYIADNPDVDLGGVARDLAAGAEYSFEKDEWISLLKYFKWDDAALLDYITGQIRSPAQNEGNKMKIKKSQLRRIIEEEKARLSENSVRVMADSGPVTMSANLNRDGTNTVTIRFDNSYTLRLDEQGLESMRNMIHQALLNVIAEK